MAIPAPVRLTALCLGAAALAWASAGIAAGKRHLTAAEEAVRDATNAAEAAAEAPAGDADPAAVAAAEAAKGAADAAADAMNAACDPADAACAAGEVASFDIAAPFGNAVMGPKDADVTMVVFVDYGCPACREQQALLDQLLAEDPKLRIVYRLTVNDEHKGRKAAMASLSVALTDGDWASFHRALDAGGQPTLKTITAAARQAGIDPVRLIAEMEADMNAPAELSQNEYALSERKGEFVPAWLIGAGNAAGFDLAKMKAAIAAARAISKP